MSSLPNLSRSLALGLAIAFAFAAPAPAATPSVGVALDTDDQRTWRIRLRRGVRFHDGRPLTAADVVYSLHRHTVAATASKFKAIADQFESIEASGPLEAHLTLRGPNADLVLAGVIDGLAPQAVGKIDGALKASSPRANGLKTSLPGVVPACWSPTTVRCYGR